MTSPVGSKSRFYLAVLLAAALMTGGCAQSPTQLKDTILYPDLPQRPRIQFLTQIRNEESLYQAKSSGFRDFVVGDEQKSARQLGRPFALGHNRHNLYVLDKVWQTVVRIDLSNGEFHPIRDMRGGAMEEPQSIFVSEDGILYVADSKRREILIYNERGEFESSFKLDNNIRPVDIAARDDLLYVVDLNGHAVLVLDSATGEVVESIGGLGREPGLFNKPTNLAIDPNGNIFITDLMNNRAQMFDEKGSFVRAFGANERYFGGAVKPKGLDADHSGLMYLTDAAFSMVTIWDSETGTPLMPFGQRSPRGEASIAELYLPTDVHIDYDNVDYFQKFADPMFDLKYIVYVANSLVAINVYGFGEWKGSLEPRKAERKSKSVPDDIDSVRGLEDLESVEEL